MSAYRILDSSKLAEIKSSKHQVIAVMPFLSSKKAVEAAVLLTERSGVDFDLVCVYDEHQLGFVSIINSAFKLSSNTYFIYLAEDVFCGRNWLEKALESFKCLNGGLLAFNDGKWFGELAAFGMVSRDWAKDIYGGDLFYSGYRSHYGDVELSLIAFQQNKLIYNPDSVIIEVDFNKDKKAVNHQDKLLFKNRKEKKFDGLIHSENLLSKFK